MKRILISTDCFLPRWDGVARFLSELIPHLAKNFKITVIAPEFPGRIPEFENVDIIRFPLLKIQFGDINFSWVNKQTVEEIVKRHDIVFNQTIGPIGAAAIDAAIKHDKPVISYIHSIEWEVARNALRHFGKIAELIVKKRAKNYYNKSNLLLVPSDDIGNLLSINSITTRKKTIKLGVDTGRFIPPMNKFPAKKAIGVEGRIVIGFCGRIGREKDIPTLRKAFRIVHRKYPKTLLLIVGTGIHQKRNNSDHIKMVGSTDNVVPYLQAMDIFVLPSLTETSSLATMEAMSTGLPVIVTPVGSIREYITSGKNGLIFQKGDSYELAEKILKLIENEKMRMDLGTKARQTIIDQRNWHDTVKQIIELIQDI